MARVLTNWIETYLKFTQETEAPRNFHFWTALFTLAGAMERKVTLDMGLFEWTPNLYVIFVGKPGIVTKSTTLRIGENLLLETGVKFGPKSMTWQALIGAFQDAQKMVQAPGLDPIADPHDIQASLTFFVSELGNFIDTKDRALMDFLVEIWDGQKGPWERRTVSHGSVKLMNPWINLIGATTPSWLQSNFSADMVGGGFASRMITVYGAEKRKLIAYPGYSGTGLDETLRAPLIKDLQHIHSLVGTMRLDDEAIAWGEQWYIDHNLYMKTHNEGARKADYLARRQTHLHKIAMIWSIARSDSLKITKGDLVKAFEILKIVEKDLDFVLSNVTNSQFQARNKQEVLAIVANGHAIEKSEVYRKLYAFMSYRDFDNAITDLMQAGHIEQLNKDKKVWLSRIS
jgi:hypothetical protein